MSESQIVRTLRALGASLAPDKWLLAAAVVLSIVNSLSSLIGLTALVPVVALIAGEDTSGLASIPYIGPYVLSLTIDRSLIFYTLVGAILGLSVARAVLAVLTSAVEAHVKRRTVAFWHGRVLTRWLNASFENHSAENTGNILHITGHEVFQVGSASRAVVQLLASLIHIALIMMFLSVVSLPALLGVSAVVVFLVLPIAFVVQKNFDAATLEARFYGMHTRKVHDVIKRIELIDIFGMGKKEDAAVKQVFRDYLRSTIRYQFYGSLAPMVVQFCVSGILAFLLIYFFNAGSGASSLATVILFIGGIATMHPHVDRVTQGIAAIARLSAAYAAIEPVVMLPGRTEEVGPAQPDPKDVNVEIVGLSFGYGSHGSLPLLQDVNLNLPSGRLIMLFGATGTGKTTFLRLLQRLLKQQAGTICYGGVDLAEMDYQAIRRTVLMTKQDGLTFTGTIRENVSYGLDDLSDDALANALKLAAADEFVSRLPQGVDQHIGNDGALLSGGQRQRISLARIIAAAPRVMLLDEPTSALDRDVEHRVMESFFHLRGRGHTLIMSTHKVELAPLADMVLWFEGRTIEGGSFEDFQHSLENLAPKLRAAPELASAK